MLPPSPIYVPLKRINMSFDFSKIKEAARAAGYLLSEGEHILAEDFQHLEHWAFSHFGLSRQDLHYGLAYPGLLPKNFPGQPGAEQAPAPVAAPIPEPTNVEAPAAEQAPDTPQAPEATPEPAAEQAPTPEAAPQEPAAEQPPVQEQAPQEQPAAEQPAAEQAPAAEQPAQDAAQ
ncbi:hypothetical protein [Ralstonia phage phiRSL1]|uniref:Uncharacterized protein n=1 Tax=Ralstonia phage phiRSL1 TaxID=1980924 RepID=B2ZXY8_9CAUD|nr:hypothetical protein RSL1_ORF130 [Ralstonia phage phiRSL1]BAG41575.1 hypothetical protein [Ralstonia phage phiRSL1]